MGQTGGERAVQRVPVGEGDHQDVAGTALLGHDRHQSVSTEPDRRQPIVFGHGEKVPAGCAIVKSPCGALFCWRSAGDPSGPGSPRPANPECCSRAKFALVPLAVVGGLLLAACSDGAGPGGVSLDCTQAGTQSLAVGEHRLLDPTTEVTIRLRPDANAASATPRIARLFASVPPEVKTISSASQPSSAETRLRACSTASFARRPQG